MSKRVYRDAWSQEAALSLLREESGTAFDPRCVAALEQVLEAERHSPAPSRCADAESELAPAG